MISVKYLLWAHNISIDTQDNSLSIFNIIEDISASMFPATLNKFTKFLVVTERELSDPSKFMLLIKIQQNKVDLILPLHIEVKFEKLKKNRLIINVPDLLFQSETPIIFSVYYKDKILGGYNVDCIKKEIEAPQKKNLIESEK